ncbi:MAG: SH3 domain-containing protein [Winogradskyella sp.]|nr:MAG: SH3 domain-containing protein [Winogradskyella sp.]
MKVFVNTLIVILVAFSLCAQSQDIAYVAAESGLSIREKPSLGSKKIGKLEYRQQVKITGNSNVSFSLYDEGKEVSGEWVKIETKQGSGYVFDGFLSSREIYASKEITFKDLVVYINDLDVYNIEGGDSMDLTKKNKLSLYIELGSSPEGKSISIKSNKYKTVKILQRYENSITIMNEGPHCDLTEWKHFNSKWMPVHKINSNKYRTLSYSEKDWNKFVNVSMADVKKAVLEQCGEGWAELIKDSKSVKDYPIGVSTSRIFLKFILTDFDDNVSEKIVEFTIPMGC